MRRLRAERRERVLLSSMRPLVHMAHVSTSAEFLSVQLLQVQLFGPRPTARPPIILRIRRLSAAAGVGVDCLGCVPAFRVTFPALTTRFVDTG